MQTWAAQELSASNLGDARLNKRLVAIVDSRDTERSAPCKYSSGERNLVADQSDLPILG